MTLDYKRVTLEDLYIYTYHYYFYFIEILNKKSIDGRTQDFHPVF